MANLSTCHGKPVVRGTSSGHPVCSQCGNRQATAKRKANVGTEAVKAEGQKTYDLMSDRWLYREKPEDTRDFVRHLSDPSKYSACGIRWFRTTDSGRVNCELCKRTQVYKDAMNRRKSPDTP